MRRPKIVNVWAKGVQAIKSTLGLSTKGIQDQKIGGKPLPYSRGFERTLWVIAAKRFDSRHIYSLKAKLNRGIRISYKTVASVINNFNKKTKVYSKINRPLNSSLIIKANKTINYNNRLSIASKKQFKIEKLINVKSNKVFRINKNLLISGKKITNFRTNKIVKAKKDILPILIAAGLLGENNERI